LIIVHNDLAKYYQVELKKLWNLIQSDKEDKGKQTVKKQKNSQILIMRELSLLYMSEALYEEIHRD
jgi:hypothetical protein